VKKFDSEVRLAREMTTLDATLIGVGAMIGAGIFVLIGIAAGVAGPGLLLTFILNGFIALLTAMSYAELGSCYHDAGGGYLWVKEGLPKWNGFVSGWMSWFAHAVACSLYALGFGAYFEHLLGEFSITIPYWGFFSPQKILAAGTTILFAYVNFRGASEAGKIGNLITLTKIVILLIFIGFGLELIFRQGDWMTTFSPFLPHGYGGVFKSMGLTFIAFQGFEVIAQSSEEIKNPRRNIPRAVFFSLIIVVPIYILVAFVAMGTVKSGSMTPWDYLAKQKEIALVDVAKNFFVGGGVMLLIGGLISTISALNATIYSSSRVAFAMGRDRNFPSFFSKVHRKNHTPHWSILVSLFIIIIMAVSLPIEDVASAADIMFLLLFLQVNLAMIRLRKKRKDLNRGFITPFFPYLSILGILLLLFLAIYMFNYSLTAWIVTIIWVAIGLSVYKFYAADREIEHVRKVSTLARISKQDYTILVCLSKTDNIKSMCQIAFSLAKMHHAQLVFLHVIELGEERNYNSNFPKPIVQRTCLRRLRYWLMPHPFQQGPSLKSRIEFLKELWILPWRRAVTLSSPDVTKWGGFASRFFSSAIDNVLQKTTNEVAILHGEVDARGVKRILIPYNDDIHTRLAIELSPALANYFEATVTIAIVVDPEMTVAARQQIIERIMEDLTEIEFSAEIETFVDTDILHGIIGLSKKSDLLVMGGKSGDFIELLFAKSLTREITEQAPCPVLWLKEYEERESFFMQCLSLK